jgi:hypothetical protein
VLCLVTGAWRSKIATHHVLTAPQLSISQRALGKLPEDGSNVMPKNVGATIHN